MDIKLPRPDLRDFRERRDFKRRRYTVVSRVRERDDLGTQGDIPSSFGLFVLGIFRY